MSKSMKAEKFVAETTSKALSMAKSVLGKDAVILSHRMLNDQAEVFAMRGEDLLESKEWEDFSSTVIQSNAPMSANFKEELDALRSTLKDSIAKLHLERELSCAPEKILLFQKLRKMGFSSDFINELGGASDAVAIDKIINQMSLSTVPFFGRKKIKAFIGPSGAGKTQLIAKIILKFLGKELNGHFSFIFVNHSNLKAWEESKLYHRIFNVTAHYAETYDELEKYYDRCKDDGVLFLDLPPYDFTTKENNFYIDFLMAYKDKIDNTMVLPSGSKECEKYFSLHKEVGCENISITKLDETKECGEILDYAIQNKIPLRFLNEGQNFRAPLLLATHGYFRKCLKEGLNG